MAKKPIYVQLLIDRSGSMASNWSETISAINLYAQKLYDDKNLKPTIAVSFFEGDDGLNIINKPPMTRKTWVPLSSSDPEIAPCGLTPLYDAIAETIEHIRNANSRQPVAWRWRSKFSDGSHWAFSDVRLEPHDQFITEALYNESDETKPSELIQFVIMTDGQENSSRKYNLNKVKSLLKEIENKNWSTIFLGANLDAYWGGQTLGVNAFRNAAFDYKNLDATVNALYASGTRYAATASNLASNFTDTEKKSMVGHKGWGDLTKTTPDDRTVLKKPRVKTARSIETI